MRHALFVGEIVSIALMPNVIFIDAPILKPTKIVEPEYTTYKSGKRMATWYAEAIKLPKAERESKE